MTDKKVEDLTELTTPDVGDWLYALDISDTVDPDKKLSIQNALDVGLTVASLTQLNLSSTGILYFGDADTNGSTRLRSAGLIQYLETRIGGTWITREAWVYPSGDATGVDDYTNIIAARDYLLATVTPPADTGNVVLKGKHYYTATPITFGTWATQTTVDPPSLVSDSMAILEYVGTQVSSYLFSIFGNPDIGRDRVRNIYFDCNGNSRGVLFQRQAYQCAMRNCVIIDHYEVGLDVIDCWKAVIEDCRVESGEGIGLRIHTGNQLTVRNCRIGTNENANWPSVSDTSVVDFASANVQTAANERAALVFDAATNITLQDMMFEGNNLGSIPLVCIAGDSHYIRFTSSFYCEGNDCDTQHVLIHGGATTNYANKGYTFESVTVFDEADCTFLRTDGILSDIRINRMAADSLDGLISVDGGTLTKATVEQARITNSAGTTSLPPGQFIRENGGVYRDYEPWGRLNVRTYTQDELLIAKSAPTLWLDAADLSAAGDGGPISAAWVNRGGGGESFTVTGTPTYEADGFRNGAPSVLLVKATPDYFTYTGALIPATATGTVIFVVKPATVGAVGHVVSVGDLGTDPYSSADYMTFGIDGSSPAKMQVGVRGSSVNTLVGDSLISSGDAIVGVIVGADTYYLSQINGVSQTWSGSTDDGQWSSLMDNAPGNCVIGTMIRGDSVPTVSPSLFDGHVGTVLWYTRALAWKEINDIVDMLMRKY